MIGIFSLKNYLASLGAGNLSEMSAAINRWGGLYEKGGRLSLASGICAETARLATLEFKSKISGSKRADFLNSQYERVLAQLRKSCELACAKGGIVFKPYVSGKEIKVSCIQAESFVPLEFDSSGNISGAAFLDRFFDGRRIYTRIERHGFENGRYIIRNTAFVSPNGDSLGKQVPLSDVADWKNIEPYIEAEGVKRPLFAYLKMPMANWVDVNSPLGVSAFARACDLIEDAEAQYARLLWEFESGERALYVDEAAVKRDRFGRHILPDKRLYRLLNTGDDALFKDWTPTIRETDIVNGLNEILRRIEFNVGLAYGTLSDVQDVDRTAEEFRASKQRSYAHVCDIQGAIAAALSDLAFAMNTLCDLYGLCGDGKYEISFDFDDSIIADRKVEFEEKMRLLEQKIICPWELRAWYFGEESECAKRAVAEAQTTN
ncbi:MAG: hypothetical protein PUE13_05375 [Clostridiales bacterium]|nr:hypothetical protein [Clostridiales bacterium]